MCAWKWVSLLDKKLPENRMRPGSLDAEPGMGMLLKGVMKGVLSGGSARKGGSGTG